MNRPTTDGASSLGAPPPPKRGKLLRTILGLLLLLIIVAAVAAFLLARKSTDTAKKDVTVTECAADPSGGKPKASGTIDNHSSKTSNYLIRIAFKDAQGNSVTEGVDTVKSVEANKSATWELTGANSAKGPLTCDTKGVSRTHIPGQ